ncbi:MAG TPA: DUF4199 domain-containing protein [Cytophagales bacterium]|nr:DUF4199 domain-containing protein [Cytophagales bacterium]
MKKIVTIYGLLAGAIVTSVMVYSIAKSYAQENFDSGMLLGYASMVIAFSFIFVGVKKYRDNHVQGQFSFGKAFLIGMYISLIASTLYVIVWMLYYYFVIPDFMDRYCAYMLKDAQSNGSSAEALKVKAEEMDRFKQMYKNPIWVVLLTYSEILPVGLLMSVIAALVFKKKHS